MYHKAIKPKPAVRNQFGKAEDESHGFDAFQICIVKCAVKNEQY